MRAMVKPRTRLEVGVSVRASQLSTMTRVGVRTRARTSVSKIDSASRIGSCYCRRATTARKLVFAPTGAEARNATKLRTLHPPARADGRCAGCAARPFAVVLPGLRLDGWCVGVLGLRPRWLRPAGAAALLGRRPRTSPPPRLRSAARLRLPRRCVQAAVLPSLRQSQHALRR